LTNAWKLIPVQSPLNPSEHQANPLFSGPALLSMQSQRTTLAFTSSDQHISHLCNVGNEQRQAAQKQLDQAREKALSKQRNKDGSPKKQIPQVDTAVHFEEEQKLRKVVQHELTNYNLSTTPSPQKRKLITPPSSPPLKSILKSTMGSGDIQESSPLKQITIQRSSSAKLNYLLSRILELSKTEKIIVFSEYGPMMWYLGESLEILGIEHLIYIQRLVLSFIFGLIVDASTSITVYCYF
jgi:hypothetical protein